MLRINVWVKSLTSFFLRFIFLSLGAVGQVSSDDQPASATPPIYANSWGFNLAQDGTGFYNELAADILDEIPGAAKYEIPGSDLYRVMPFRRAQAMFFRHADSCLFPSSIVALQASNLLVDANAFIESAGLFETRVHLFVRPGDTPPSKLEDLQGKTVAVPNGSAVKKLLDGFGAQLISVNSEVDKAEMLLGERVDVISGTLPDTALIFERIKRQMPAYDPAFTVIKAPVTFVCHNNARNRQFIGAVNVALEALSSDPEYLARFAKVGLEGAVIGGAGPDNILDTYTPAVGDTQKQEGKGRKKRSGRRLPMHSN